MRYQMNQKLLSLADEGMIYDATGNPVYRVDAQSFSLREKVNVLDPEGQQVASLQDQVMALQKTMVITIGDRDVAKVVRKFLSFRKSFDIHLDSGDQWKLQGDWSDQDFSIMDHAGNTIATISLDWVTLANVYGIDIADGQDDLLVLCVLIALESAVNEDTADLLS